MKKIIIIFMIIFCLFLTVGCKKDEEIDLTQASKNVSLITPSGTPLFALNGIINNYEKLEIVTDPTLLQASLINKKTDIVICPVTMGAMLYINNKSDYLLEAILTTNNTYLISRENITIEQLKGQTISAFNETNTPGILLKMYLEENGILNDVNCQFESNVNSVVSGFVANKSTIALVSEPQLTQIENKFEINIIDLAKQLNVFVPQAAIFVNPEKVDDQEVINTLKLIKQNIEKIKTNPDKYVDELFETNYPFFVSLTKENIKKSLPRCNLDYLSGSNNKKLVEDFLTSCDKYSNTFKGKKPNDDFYKD